MKVSIDFELNSCDDCDNYEYIRCLGYDCSHADAPPESDRGEEEFAENRIGNFPKWCPYIPKQKKETETNAE